MDFINTVKETITAHKLLSTEDNSPIIVALSGGADSVALLAALTELNFQCIAAHCNFHLRGEESNRDETHARQIAERLNCEIIVKDFDVEKYCHEQNESSNEIACRNLRYNWFCELLTEANAQAIAVGHNSDDDCETLLFNIIRGSGIAGLNGIAYRNNLNVVRPLLNCSRADVESYVSQRGLTFIVDSSNLTTDFSRNKIRNAILPEMERWFPNTKKGLLKTIANVSEQERFYRQCIDDKFKIYSDGDNSIDLTRLIEAESMPALLLYEWFKDAGMTRTQANDIIKSKNSSGAKFITDNYIWTINRSRLHQYPSATFNQETDLSLECYFTITELPIADFNPIRDVNVAYFDSSVIDGTPLSVKFLQPGDSIVPFGMKGRKKVSDIMTEANIPAILKNRIPLLAKGKEILWVAGVRATSHYKVTPNSRSYICVRLKTTTT